MHGAKATLAVAVLLATSVAGCSGLGGGSPTGFSVKGDAPTFTYT